MTTDQIILFVLIGAVLGMLLWGRLRHDLVAVIGLLAAVLLGVVSEDQAFSGFSNHAVIIVALVLVASRAIENSGALGVLARRIRVSGRPTPEHIGVLGGIGAAVSGLINNVAALAILMPLDVQAARKAGRAPGRTLMPLSFATILGGMVTLIGTPSNIVAASVRNDQLGAPYAMFDFTPVGLAVALAGLLFVALIGWRLVPHREDRTRALVRDSSFEAELTVPEDSPLVGSSISALEKQGHEFDVVFLKILRGRQLISQMLKLTTIRTGDTIVVQGATDQIAAFIKSAGLQAPSEDEDAKTAMATPAGPAVTETKDEDPPAEPKVIEVVVSSQSWLVGGTVTSAGLRRWYGITLLGLARGGSLSREKIQNRTIEAGDLLLVSTYEKDIAQLLAQLGLIAVDEASVAPFKPRNALIASGLFVAAVIAAATGAVSFTIAIAVAVAVYGALGLVPARDFYTHIDWSVVVMLACLLPIGAAFDEVGGTRLVAQGMADLTQGAPPVVALIAIMVVTMTLSDALNNVATMIITGPIAIDLAQTIGVNPDTFLMGAAVGASCAFLTPIGHKNNTLIMGPGGFQFADYWRMGLPLELLVLAVAVPMLLWVWPL